MCVIRISFVIGHFPPLFRFFVANLETRRFYQRVFAARFFKYWLPVLIWMCVIFGASTQLGATRNTSRIIGPVLRWLNPDISDEVIENIQFGIRKSAHATEYAILSLLFWRARRKTSSAETKSWRWRDAGIAILFCALYASTDEFHQTFVAARQGSPWDVLLDTSGAAVAMVFLWFVGRKLKWW